MAGRVTGQSPDGEAGEAPPETERPGPRPGATGEAEAEERHKAETEIAAGDVADDLADFA
ncbi:hypothetical protein ACU4GR_25980 [Methylobacterium oryzae CBMB20]